VLKCLKIWKSPSAELAKTTMEKLLDHFLYVMELHANNSFVVYSPALSRQIPKSFAANAFNVFQRGMYQIEIIRLCALWDEPKNNRLNIPTVVELIDNEKVIEALAEETRRQWANQPGAPELKAVNLRFGEEQAAKSRVELKEAIDAARSVRSSPSFIAVMNTRHKLAHSL